MIKPLNITYIFSKNLLVEMPVLPTTVYNCFERVEEFKYLGTTLTNQNSIPEEIKGSLRSRYIEL